MIYEHILEGRFIERPNRFIAKVLLNGELVTVHVKNTGRCRELLVPDARVILDMPDRPNRKTKYDLIGVYKGDTLFNMDSQAPNRVVAEWLQLQPFSLIRPEYRIGESRIDFYMERGEERYFLEVKGCTLEENGIGYFPDAPTERGLRHIHELRSLSRKGFHAAIAFVIQMEGVEQVLPNDRTMPEFGAALREASADGVKIFHLTTRVTPDSLVISSKPELWRWDLS